MLRYLMSLILAVRRNMKLMMTLNLCPMPLKKKLDINYTYGSLEKPLAKEILCGVTILFIAQRMDERGGLSRTTQR